jgi:hypothetical protein
MDAFDIEDLEDFVGWVDRLARSPMYHEYADMVSSLEIKWQKGQPGSATTKEPPDAIVTAFVTLLRPLIVPSGRLCLRRIFDLCDQRLIDAELLERLRAVRAMWRDAQRRGPINLVVDEERWRPERVTWLIVNAYYAHSDREKKRRLEALGGLGVMLTRQLFWSYVLRSGVAAKETADVVRVGLSDGRFR